MRYCCLVNLAQKCNVRIPVPKRLQISTGRTNRTGIDRYRKSVVMLELKKTALLMMISTMERSGDEEAPRSEGSEGGKSSLLTDSSFAGLLRHWLSCHPCSPIGAPTAPSVLLLLQSLPFPRSPLPRAGSYVAARSPSSPRSRSSLSILLLPPTKRRHFYVTFL